MPMMRPTRPHSAPIRRSMLAPPRPTPSPWVAARCLGTLAIWCSKITPTTASRPSASGSLRQAVSHGHGETDFTARGDENHFRGFRRGRLTTFAFGWIFLSPMRRKFLAFLLISSWVILSGFDLLEDLDSPSQFSVQSANSCDGPLPNVGSGVNIVNNIVESAHHRQPSYPGLFDSPSVHSSVDTALSFKKASRLHKLHCVFLI
jgi:hypothetical protein